MNRPTPGFRTFFCTKCRSTSTIPTRDCWSQSSEPCGQCSYYASVVDAYQCYVLATDESGNLLWEAP